MRRRQHIARRYIQLSLELSRVRTIRAIFLAPRRAHSKRPGPQSLQPLLNFFARFSPQARLVKRLSRNDKEGRHRKCRRQLGKSCTLATR
jgi:hypothetical protein